MFRIKNLMKIKVESIVNIFEIPWCVLRRVKREMYAISLKVNEVFLSSSFVMFYCFIFIFMMIIFASFLVFLTAITGDDKSVVTLSTKWTIMIFKIRFFRVLSVASWNNCIEKMSHTELYWLNANLTRYLLYNIHVCLSKFKRWLWQSDCHNNLRIQTNF